MKGKTKSCIISIFSYVLVLGVLQVVNIVS